MKGDFTRSTFDPKKHYRGVRMQQGRVQLDADWNEQVDIATYRTEVGAADVIGLCGGPLDGAGFALTNGIAPQITRGRYYVDGILCENEALLDLDKQPDLPNFKLPVAVDAGASYLVYLDVWQRHVTWLDDPLLREVALGGPDTATRSRTVWQVKLLGPIDGAANCLSRPEGWAGLIDPRDGTQLNARAREKGQDAGECEVAPGSGYRRLENQLYRVEIHQGGPAGAGGATFKWSRDNGSIVARWTSKVDDDLIVDSIGRDDVLRFEAGQWVELIDDERELNGLPGTLVQLLKAEGQALTIKPATATGTVDFADFGASRKIRRWDHAETSDVALANGAVPVSEGAGDNGWIPLEDGVEVQFQAGGDYRTGDYWLIPARTNTADIEWPRDPNDPTITLPKRREGIRHHFCPLGLLQQSGAEFFFTDCRDLFPPVTLLTVLHYAGGDGQEAPAGQQLPFPLRVRVLNGEVPVAGAAVSFTVLDGGGALLGASPVSTSAADGLAEMGWQLGLAGPQRVEAALLDPTGKPVPGQRIQFGANVAVAGGGGCCTCVGPGGDYETLEAALIDLINRGQRDICICMLAGPHKVSVDRIEQKFDDRPLHIKITGCGEATLLLLERPLQFEGVTSLDLRDLAIRPRFVADDGRVALDFALCEQVKIEGCSVVGLTAAGSLVQIVNSDKVRVASNRLAAFRPDSFAALREILTKFAPLAGGDALDELFKEDIFDEEEFRQRAIAATDRLVQLGPDDRKALAQAVQQVVAVQVGLAWAFGKIYLQLISGTPATREAWVGSLVDLWRTVLKVWHGAALVLGDLREANVKTLGQLGEMAPLLDQDDLYEIESNTIEGALSLYGQPPAALVLPKEINADAVGSLKRATIPAFAMMGSVLLRGNKVARVTVAEKILQWMVENIGGQAALTYPWDGFGRLLYSDNVIEGAGHAMVGQQATLTTNQFSGFAVPSAGANIAIARIGPGASMVVAANRALYLGNSAAISLTIYSSVGTLDQAVNQGVTLQ